MEKLQAKSLFTTRGYFFVFVGASVSREKKELSTKNIMLILFTTAVFTLSSSILFLQRLIIPSVVSFNDFFEITYL